MCGEGIISQHLLTQSDKNVSPIYLVQIGQGFVMHVNEVKMVETASSGHNK